METSMQTYIRPDEGRKSLVAAAGRAAVIGAALSALVAAAQGAPVSQKGIGQAVMQNDMQHRQLQMPPCIPHQILTFPIVTADAPGMLSTTWSVVPPRGVASVAGTNPYPAWVTPPTGIFWEQAVTPPPTPTNPINEQAGPSDFRFKATFGPLPPRARLASVSISGAFTADNDGAVYLNAVNVAHRVGYCPPTYGPPPAGFGAKCFTTTFPLSSVPTDYRSGMNTVIVDVHNNEFVSGFVIDGTVTAVCR
jgi:hypothetical protein